MKVKTRDWLSMTITEKRLAIFIAILQSSTKKAPCANMGLRENYIYRKCITKGASE